MRLTFHPEADAEYTKAAQYYARQVPGLGAEFLEAIEKALDDIKLTPLRWHTVRGDQRRYLVERFPFAVVYRVLSEEIRVVAVAHHSCDPEYWHGRMDD